MPFMSYCRFERTYSALADCAEHLLDPLDKEEASYRRKMLELCIDMLGKVSIRVDDDELPPDDEIEDYVPDEEE